MAKKPENPKAFKHWIGPDLLQRMSQALKSAYPAFDTQLFLSIEPQLLKLELKPRVQLIRDQLHKQLPHDYKKSLAIILKSLNGDQLKGFDLWPYTEYVQKFGLNDLSDSLEALRLMTQKFTGEFAVRPFLNLHAKKTLDYLYLCARDKNVHVRRWVSEGSRPRLPWGERLHDFIKNPQPTLKLLEVLKYDPELYVRKSVANHLNDISKDHPEIAIQTLARWQKSAPTKHKKNIDWIVRHALRTLIKKGHPQALDLIGVSPQAKIKIQNLKINKKKFTVGERLEFSFLLQSLSTQDQQLVIDYLIHFKKANGQNSEKVFKFRNLKLMARQQQTLKKTHHLKPVTTRKFYPGRHILEIQVNGLRRARAEWHLHAP